MINLAGIDPTETDQAVYAELMAARVDVMVDAEAIEERGEVCTRYRGRIGKSSFRRAWRYWVVNCKIPLLEASGLYAHKAKIRAGGHCEDPDPSSQVEYFLGDTKVCVDPDGSQERELLAFIKAYGPLKSPLPIFTPNADLIGAKPFVTLYHVDTILGLCLIADTIRGLMGTEWVLEQLIGKTRKDLIAVLASARIGFSAQRVNAEYAIEQLSNILTKLGVNGQDKM